MAIKRKEEEEVKGKEQEKEEEEMVMMYYENISKPRKLPLNSLATILMAGANWYALTEMIKSPESKWKWKTVPFPSLV